MAENNSGLGGSYATFSSLSGNTSSRSNSPNTFNIKDALGQQSSYIGKMIDDFRQSNSASSASGNNTATSGAANNLAGAALNNIDKQSKKQVDTLVSVYKVLQQGNDSLKSVFTENNISTKKLDEQIRKLTAAVSNNGNGGRSSGGNLKDLFNDSVSGFSGGNSRNITRAESGGGFLGKTGRILGGAAKIAGGIGGAIGLYDGISNIAEIRGTPLFGNEQTGGIAGSRAANYGQSALSGAATGAAIGSIIPGVGTAIGAGVGGAVGLGAGLISDYAPQIGEGAKSLKNNVTKGLSSVQSAVQEISKKTYDTVIQSMPSWASVEKMAAKSVQSVEEFISSITSKISRVITAAYEWIKGKIPDWEQIKQKLGFGAETSMLDGAPQANDGKSAVGSSNSTSPMANNGVLDTIRGTSQGGSGTYASAANNAATRPMSRDNIGTESTPGNNGMGGDAFDIKGAASPTSIAGAIGKGESKGGDIGIFNGGAGNNYKVGHLDAENTTLSEVMRRQNLGMSDSNKIFAAGAYQMIPGTLKEGVEALKLDPNKTMFGRDTQNQLFTDYLATKKRPEVGDYVTGKSGNLDAAHHGLANEFASIAYGGKGVYDKDGVNHASVSDKQIQESLMNARKAYQEKIASGMNETQAKREALLGITKDNNAKADTGKNTSKDNPNVQSATAANDGGIGGNIPANTASANNSAVASNTGKMKFASFDSNKVAAQTQPDTSRAPLPQDTSNDNNDGGIGGGDNSNTPAQTNTSAPPRRSMVASNRPSDSNNGGGQNRTTGDFDSGNFSLDSIPTHITTGGLIIVNSGKTQ